MTKKRKRTVPHEDGLLEDFKDPKFLEAYLNDMLQDIHTIEGQQMFLITLNRIAKVHGMSHTAEVSNVQRESLYKALSKKGNPRLSTFSSVLHTLGFGLQVKRI